MKKSLSSIYLLLLLVLGITNYASSQSLTGTWDNVSGPGDPIRYIFLNDSTVIIQFQTTPPETANYATLSIPSSGLREIDLGQSGIVGWKGIYQISSDSSGLQIEGYWHTGLPQVATPTSFNTPTTYDRVTSGIERNRTEISQTSIQFQCYPNQIERTMTFRLSIPERAFIKLNVFDSKGRKLETLISSICDAGSYNLLFDARGFRNGAYFFQLTIGNHTFAKQVNLIR